MVIVEPKLPFSELSVDTLSLHEKIFLSAFQKAYRSGEGTGPQDRFTTAYKIDPRGLRMHAIRVTQADIQEVIMNFKSDPKRALATGRNNLLAILGDATGGNLTARKYRLDRYLISYFALIEKLDHAAFPPQADVTKVQYGVPDYIPDGLSDMGSDPKIEPKARTREKIRVDKKGVFQQEKQFLKELFEELASNGFDVTDDPDALEAMKQFIIGRICNHVYTTVQYDYAQKLKPQARYRSVLASEYDTEGVCRHKAMRAQILFQAMGITSRLLKCDLNEEAHVANLVRINHQWHLVDPTNPIYYDAKTDSYTFGGSATKISLDDIKQKREITIRIPVENGTPKIRRYKARDNMYYRILRN